MPAKAIYVRYERGMLQSARVIIFQGGLYEVSVIGRRDQTSQKASRGILPNAELKNLLTWLSKGSAKLFTQPRKDPMWPSAYDGADIILQFRKAGKVVRWSNEKYDPGSEKSFPSLPSIDKIVYESAIRSG